ncbi:DUF2625 domain-containing protein [Streptomyces sp. NBC_00247]|uniref:DUF2625 family protein n=1 Tax=Streptomyces sp. NBC_00247 TaxID=2975689 RepID=UPI002E2E450C|nr:DUF2625 family protein [Streptomyces sp. NBC_00247]
MRALDELVHVDNPAWPEVRELFSAGTALVEVFPVDRDEAERCLLRTQVTVASTLGALAWHSGGLLVDGWVRVFGGGGGGAGFAGEGRLPSLARVNAFPAGLDATWYPAGGLIVGHDVLGGVFALNGHDPAAADRPGLPGQMIYFAPDSLEWEALDMGHSGWISWLASGGTDGFYQDLRWPGWREEAAALSCAQGFSVYPFLWSKEAHDDLAATSRRAVPMREVLGVAADFARQMGPADPGFLGRV